MRKIAYEKIKRKQQDKREIHTIFIEGVFDVHRAIVITGILPLLTIRNKPPMLITLFLDNICLHKVTLGPRLQSKQWIDFWVSSIDITPIKSQVDISCPRITVHNT